MLSQRPIHLSSLAFGMILIAAFGGCARLLPQRVVDYRTMEANPNHDTESAREKNEKALHQIEKGHCSVAERLLQESLVADVTFGPAHNNLGQLYFQHGKYYLAAWEFEYAARLMPDRAEPINNVGLVYEAVGKLDEAIASFETAHALCSEHRECLANLVRARWRRGDRDDETVALLRELTFRDDRPQWRQWAEQTLVLHESRRSPLVQPLFPDAAPSLEVIPVPPSVPETDANQLPVP